jgi:hypothetical protein
MKKVSVKEQKKSKQTKSFKDNRKKEKKTTKRSLYMFLQKSDDEINTARTDDRRVQKQAIKFTANPTHIEQGLEIHLGNKKKKR